VTEFPLPVPSSRTNCLFFAIHCLWSCGGYLIVRKSHFGWWPHFLWSPDLVEFWEYVPLVRPDVLFPPPFFSGYVRKAKESLPQ
jgi:hypothetical protein